MKKTFQVNISGKVFYIDEDAYELLLNYLNQLKEAFSGAEGEEIVTDIENRISELFDERIAGGVTVIVYQDVNRIIEIMGKPSDISEDGEDCRAGKAENAAMNGNPSPTVEEEKTVSETEIIAPAKKKLYRNISDKILGGVLSGVATYLDWDLNILRVLYVVLAILSYGWPLTVIYFVAWMIIPPANTPRRVLEMKGEDVTVNSIGQTILSTATPPPYSGVNVKESFNELKNNNIIGRVISFVCKCIMSFIGIAGALGAIVATVFTLIFLVAVIAAGCFDSFAIISWFTHGVTSILAALAFLVLSMCFILPCITLAWLGAAVVFNARGAAKTTVFISLAVETIFIVVTVVLFIYLNSQGYYL